MTKLGPELYCAVIYLSAGQDKNAAPDVIFLIFCFLTQSLKLLLS